MAGTSQAFMCFWLLMLIALSSEEITMSDARTCMPAVGLGCLKSDNCRKPCLNDDPDNNSWRCLHIFCLCCRP
ncbi:unnamed protein product [Miscanthus lutarioriparius]|uniref:Uncharacterized protein n=1 Tax=Miscanthus lutarioriparius TaxID=422564 RepID=A0A811MXS2_9POAL|nr:unnamed protein product [Miscanthus lutarioriparius]